MSSQPCRQRTGGFFWEPQTLTAMWPQGTASFNSENRPCPAFSKSSEPGRKSHSSWTTAVLSTQITKHRHSEVQMTKLIQKDRGRHHDSGTPAGPTQVRCVPELTFSCCWLQSAIPNSNKHTPLTKKLSELSDHVAHLDPTVWLCRIWELKIGPAQAVGRAVSVSSTG